MNYDTDRSNKMGTREHTPWAHTCTPNFNHVEMVIHDGDRRVVGSRVRKLRLGVGR